MSCYVRLFPVLSCCHGHTGKADITGNTRTIPDEKKHEPKVDKQSLQPERQPKMENTGNGCNPSIRADGQKPLLQPEKQPKIFRPGPELSGFSCNLRGPFRTVADSCSAFRDQKVAGSNPVTSTSKVGRFCIAYQLFLVLLL